MPMVPDPRKYGTAGGGVAWPGAYMFKEPVGYNYDAEAYSRDPYYADARAREARAAAFSAVDAPFGEVRQLGRSLQSPELKQSLMIEALMKMYGTPTFPK